MNILEKILHFFKSAAAKVKEALGFGKEVANAVKEFTDSPLLDIVVKITPIKYDDLALEFIRRVLPIWIDKMGWAEKKIRDFDESTLPHVLNAISAESAKLYAEYKQIELSRPQAIAGAQVVYNPDIVKV